MDIMEQSLEATQLSTKESQSNKANMILIGIVNSEDTEGLKEYNNIIFALDKKDIDRVRLQNTSVVILQKEAVRNIEDINDALNLGATSIIIDVAQWERNYVEGLYSAATAMNLDILLNVSDVVDIAKIRRIKPGCVILSDNGLEAGHTNKLNPIFLRELIDWDCRIVYRCNHLDRYTVEFIYREGFAGIISSISSLCSNDINNREVSEKKTGLWTKLYGRRRYTRPLVKIGSISRGVDASLALNLGADIVSVDINNSREVIENLPETDSIKMVSVGKSNVDDISVAVKFLNDGIIDGIEFDETYSLDDCINMAGSNFIRTINPLSVKDIDSIKGSSEARTIIAPYSAEKPNEILYDYSDNISRHLWICGDKGGEIKTIVKKFKPELIDISTSILADDGTKDPILMRKLFKDVLYEK